MSLWKNVEKTVGMVCHPFHAAGNQLEAAYEKRMKGDGIPYRERQRVRVKCLECGEEMVTGSLAVHQNT